MNPDTSTRRRILGAIGSVGLLYVGAHRGRAALGLETVETNQQMQIETAGPMPDVTLDWLETVNGVVQEDTDLGTVTDGNTGDVGFVIDESVVPGDSGTLTMRATLVEGEETAESQAELLLRFLLSGVSENGLNEPERAANDDPTSDVGELHEFTAVTIWEDTGVGSGNGTLERIPVAGDEVIADGTLATIGSVIGDGYLLDKDGESCFDVGDSIYVSLRWEVPSDVANVVQGDEATFVVGFQPRACGGQ